MWLYDNDVPNMAAPGHTGRPSGWTKAATITTSLSAAEPDPGLGVKYFNLFRGENFETLIGQRQHPCSGDRHGRCPISWNASFSYGTDSMPEGTNTLKAVAYDAVGKWGPSSVATWTVKVDRSAPAVQLSGRLKELEGGGLYDDAYGLRLDITDPHSGIKSAELLVDGRRLRPEHYVEETCSSAGCPNSRMYDFTFHPAGVADGERTVKVVVKDQLGTAFEQSWTVVVDRRGDIYRARKYAVFSGSERVPLDEQWARINTHDVRSEDGDWITTRTTVTDDGEPYDEVRARSTLSEAGDDDQEEAYTVPKGKDTDDANLPIVADMLAPARELTGRTPAATGPLNDVIEPWQTPPPAYGETYARYDVSGEFEDESGGSQPGTEQIWIDERTKMPIKFVVVSAAGEELGPRVFFSYDRNRLESGEVAADFFRIGAPPQKGFERTTTNHANDEAVGAVADQETGQSFRAYYLGTGVSLASGTVTFAESDVIQTRHSAPAGAPSGSEPDLLPEDQPPAGADAPSTLVNAYYRLAGPGVGAVGGSATGATSVTAGSRGSPRPTVASRRAHRPSGC